MKTTKMISLVTAAVGLVVTSCASDAPEYKNSVDQCVNVSYTLTTNEAIGIAETFITKGTRSISETPEIIPVLNTIKTRSSENGLASDTAAYILNYPDSKMFAIIANDSRVEPVLAFSEENDFDINNQTVKESFINQIPSFLNAEITGLKGNPAITPADTIKPFNPNPNPGLGDAAGPYLIAELSQNAPYNKYMNEYPECTICHSIHPAGCVTVAEVCALSYALTTLNYEGIFYNFVQLNEALSEGKDRVSPTVNNPYTYESALDATARLLYYYGKNIGVSFTHYDTDDWKNIPCTILYEGTEMINSMNHLASLGCTVSPKISPFDCEKAIEYLKDKHLLLARGHTYDASGGGHMWVIDGYKIIPISGNRPNVDAYPGLYLHCDFGWGGSSNGYYKPLAFKELKLHTFGMDYFYAVKMR